MKPRSVMAALLTTSCVLTFLGIASYAKAQTPKVSDASARSEPPNTQGNATPAAADERYQIGPSDVLEVLVYNHPQLSRPAVRVDGRGMIRLPLLDGEIKAACKTESDLSSELTARYREYQKYPQVDVYVREFNSQPVAVLGAVRTPGRFQLQRRVRLLELLSLTGGATAAAGRLIQVVHGAGGPQLCGADADPDGGENIASYVLKDTFHGVEAANPYVAPGDMVYVAEADQVYVVGNVPKPAAIPLTEQITISEAIFMAGGVLPDSAQNRIRLLRRAPGSTTKTEIVVNFNTIKKGSDNDLVLQANDVIEVPKEGGAKSVLRGIMNAIVPTTMSLPMRVIY